MRSTSVGLSMTVVLCYAHPYRWTYTGEPLIRDTPFSRTRRQQRHGRACFRPRPKRFERLFYSPRPYAPTGGFTCRGLAKRSTRRRHG
jgi:hypothetical protein